jgi:hypothetical protein
LCSKRDDDQSPYKIKKSGKEKGKYFSNGNKIKINPSNRKGIKRPWPKWKENTNFTPSTHTKKRNREMS